MAASGSFSDIFSRQRAFNDRTARCWDDYTSHRRQISQRLLDLSSPMARLLVLGAGNCNDLDLSALIQAYREITLLDWDAESLQRGTQTQFSTPPASLRLWSGFELTGILPTLAAAKNEDQPRILEPLLAGKMRPDLPSDQFEVVVSTCMLSQLIDAANAVVIPTQQPIVATALRQQHLSIMGQFLLPGGTGLLITDFVSSDTASALVSQTAHNKLKAIASQLLAGGNFFAGLHPGHLMRDVLQTPRLASPESVFCSDPWLWQVGTRRFLVLAILFRKPL